MAPVIQQTTIMVSPLPLFLSRLLTDHALLSPWSVGRVDTVRHGLSGLLMVEIRRVMLGESEDGL
jgi:hypothetical protein